MTLAAIQGLYELFLEKDAQLARQQSEILSLKDRLERLEAMLAQ